MTTAKSHETVPASEPMTIAELRVDAGVLRDLAPVIAVRGGACFARRNDV